MDNLQRAEICRGVEGGWGRAPESLGEPRMAEMDQVQGTVRPLRLHVEEEDVFSRDDGMDINTGVLPRHSQQHAGDDQERQCGQHHATGVG